MVKFDCNRCGRCCMSFGKLIRIERQVTGPDYFCRDGTTGELFLVHVLPEFADEIEEACMEPDPTGPHSSLQGCVFQKPDRDGRGFACAIYPTRPAICKKFICYRMLIYHQESGEVRGRVIGLRELRTDDEALVAIWDKEIGCLPYLPGTQRDASQNPLQGCKSRTHSRITGSLSADDHEWMGKILPILASHGYKGEPVE